MSKPSGLKLYPEKIDELFLKGELLRKMRSKFCYRITFGSGEESHWRDIIVKIDYRNKTHAHKLTIIVVHGHYTEDPYEEFEHETLAVITSMKRLESFCEKLHKDLEGERLAWAETMYERIHYRM
jgi:hypothetical protein